MDHQLTKKYGLITAIAMVVGTVIGSGIFFKATKVLNNTNGNLGKSVLTVGIVGLIMFICSYVFAVLAQKHEKVNGIVDYAEATCGPTYGYYVGWFMTVLYTPTITSTLAWVSAQYTCILFGWKAAGWGNFALGIGYLVAIFFLNFLSPKIAGKFQVSTTVIKLIPIAIMAIVGTIAGLVNGNTISAFTSEVAATGNGGIFAAVTAFAFAYEGWILTTAINSELKDSKKNLPLALVLGAVIVVSIYVLYFIGLTGPLTAEEIMAAGDGLPVQAFSTLLGSKLFGTIVSVLIVISCLGTTNGLMLACCRNMYSLAIRGEGPRPEVYSKVNAKTNIPTASAIIGLVLCIVWACQWQLGIAQVIGGGKPILPAIIAWENEELPIITLYGCYIPIFIMLMAKGKELGAFNRFVMPGVGVVCCAFMVACAISAYKIEALYYIIVFAVIMLIGTLYRFLNKKAKAAPVAEPETTEQ